MGIGKLCISFTIRRRSKKRSESEYAEPEPRTMTEVALSNSLILNEIISRLPHQDVLNCRLVSQSWNSEAISILRRQNTVIAIDGQNYQSYLFQLLRTSHKSVGLPAYKCDQSLKLSVRIEKYSNQQEFDKISLGLTTLVRLFECGSCIDSVHVGRGLDWKMHCSWQKLIKSLTFCGAGLRHMTINCAIVLETPEEQLQQIQAGGVASSPVNAPNPKAIADVRLMLDAFSFPQLESLNLTLALGNNFSVLALTAIINAVPRLRRLTVDGNGNSTSKYNCQLVQILRGVRSLAWLEELELDIGNGSCFQALRPFVLSRLTTLRLQCSRGGYPRLAPVVDQAQHLNYFLRSNCPLLASLDFYFEPSTGGVAVAAGAGQEFPLGLPILANLTSFGYHGGALDAACYINVHKSALVPATMFPALRSISTNFGAMLSFGQCIWSDRRAAAGEDGNAHLSPKLKFEQVDTVFLKHLQGSLDPAVSGGGGGGSPGTPGQAASPSSSTSRCSVEDNVHQLRTLYPNLKRLVLDNEFCSSSSLIGSSDGVPEILFLLLKRFPNLDALEIRNYCRDWMYLVAAAAGRIIPNLKQLTLSTADRATFPTDFNLPDLNLSSIAALLHFVPNLTALNLSSGLLNPNGAAMWITNGDYVNWYPNLKIKIV